MGEIFRIAYLAELWLWVPLAVIVAMVPGMRRWIAVPLGVSALALVYEGYMTLVWERTVVAPIRVDIFLVMIAAGLVDLVAGLALLRPAISGVHRSQARIAAALCLGIVVAALAGGLGLRIDLAAVDDKLDDACRARLEAAFLTTPRSGASSGVFRRRGIPGPATTWSRARTIDTGGW